MNTRNNAGGYCTMIIVPVDGTADSVGFGEAASDDLLKQGCGRVAVLMRAEWRPGAAPSISLANWSTRVASRHPRVCQRSTFPPLSAGPIRTNLAPFEG